MPIFDEIVIHHHQLGMVMAKRGESFVAHNSLPPNIRTSEEYPFRYSFNVWYQYINDTLSSIQCPSTVKNIYEPPHKTNRKKLKLFGVTIYDESIE